MHAYKYMHGTYKCNYITFNMLTGTTNKEFNFRHDWNSLISDDESLMMRHYSKDYFPSANSYVSCISCVT